MGAPAQRSRGTGLVTYEELAAVLRGNLSTYFQLAFVTEHHFRRYRDEGGVRIYRTRPQYVRSAAHWVAHLDYFAGRLSFSTRPPEDWEVVHALRRYRPESADGPELLRSFRELAGGQGIAADDVAAVFHSLGIPLKAVSLMDEWNDRRAVFRTDAELVYLEWFTNA